LKIAPGEIFGLVGESGSGKTTFASAILRHLAENGRITNGCIRFMGDDMSKFSKKEMRKIWGSRISIVHQDPSATINPSMTIGKQISEVAREHLNMSKQEAMERALEMLVKVRVPDPELVAKRYQHQLSGGMLQRVIIAMALITNPQLLIMDEPTTALDVTTEAVILDLIGGLLTEVNSSILYITHNLGVVARICHRVGVMYAGELMESGDVRKVYKNMLHPYTRGLLGSIPHIDSGKYDGELASIPGFIPRPDALPPGCIFAPRCSMVQEKCSLTRPSLFEAAPEHFTSCYLWESITDDLKSANAPAGALLTPEEEKEPVLETQHIKKSFAATKGLSAMKSGKKKFVHAVDDMSVNVLKGNTMGIVGESGCGKTTFARCIAGLEKANAGEISLEGLSLPYSVTKRSRETLKKIQMIFQNPTASLNPHHTVGQSIGRSLKCFNNLTRKEIKNEICQLLKAVRLPDDYVHRLPHELSGGEKQRVAIARTLAADPTLIICDEPISSLDVSVQASLINLLSDIQASDKVSYLFISHDLAAVRHISDWISVVYLGKAWENGSTEDVFAPPYHPYTEALLSAIPIADPDADQKHIRLPDTVPSAVDIPSGCRFHTRCPRMLGDICKQTEPEWQCSGTHYIRCHIPLDELHRLQTQDKH